MYAMLVFLELSNQTWRWKLVEDSISKQKKISVFNQKYSILWIALIYIIMS